MTLTIGLISSVSGTKRALKKDFGTREEARLALGKYIHELMEMGWMPAYILLDDEQCMRKLTDDCYEIEL
jgi:hypothetical protein